MSTESPDVPWVKNHDERPPPKPIDNFPDNFALLFLNFLNSKKISRGKILEIEGENVANMNLFFSNGFEPCVMSPSDKFHLNYDQYGITFYCHSPLDYWPFEDQHFNFIFDLHTNFSSLDQGILISYIENFSRTLVLGGFGAVSFEDSKSTHFLSLFEKHGLVLEKKYENEIFVLRKSK